MYTGTDHTQHMRHLVSGLMDRMQALYCREDFEARLDRITNLKKSRSSYYSFQIQELASMCRCCGLEPEPLLRGDRTALDTVPTRGQLRRQLLMQMHEICLEFPTSQMFLERLVRRLLKGDFQEDSLRLAILKKFLRDTDYGAGPVLELAWNRLNTEDKAAYARLPEQAQIPFLLEHMHEDIFRALDPEPDWDTLMLWVEFLQRQLDLYPAEDFRFSPELVLNISELLAAYPAHTEPAALLEALRQTPTRDDCRLLDAVIREAKKEFSLYLKPMTYEKKTASGAKTKKGSLKEKFDQAADDFKKANTADYSLLELADDLAAGRFRPEGKTKDQLYLFAVAFDMRSYFGLRGENYDPDRDIVKNLFHDYYSDNLLRYVLSRDYLSDKTSQTAEPSGEGINFKNFKEVIYLYYLTKFPELTPRERMKKIQSLVGGCVRRAAKHPQRVQQEASERTAFFRDEFLTQVLPISKRTVLMEYLCSHYYISDPDVTKRSARIMRSATHNTARTLYRQLTEQLLTDYPDGMGSRGDRVQMNNGLDLPALLKQLQKEHGDDPDFLALFRQEEGNHFLQLLERMEEKLHTSKLQILRFYEDPDSTAVQKYTRTELITLYYCYFYFYLTLEPREGDQMLPLPQLYREFSMGVNEYLDECGYQRISEKNIYDVFVVFTLYLEQLRG